MYKTYLHSIILVVLLVGLLSSCGGDGQLNTQVPEQDSMTDGATEQVDETQTSITQSIPSPTSTHTPSLKLEPKINSLTTELGTFCAGAQTTVYFEASAPDEDALEFNWEAQFGTLSNDAETVTYTAPSDLPKERLDIITLEIKDGENTVSSSSTPVKLIDLEDTTTWQRTGGPEGGFMTSIEMVYSNPDILFAGGAGGSVLKTLDGGETWAPSTQFLPPGQRWRWASCPIPSCR